MDSQPLIFDFIEKPLGESDDINLEYSPKFDMNVALFNGEKIPLVELTKSDAFLDYLLEYQTKTLVKREEEDEPEIIPLLEFFTKTRQDREEENDRICTILNNHKDSMLVKNKLPIIKNKMLFEFSTKTKQERESEDEKSMIEFDYMYSSRKR